MDVNSMKFLKEYYFTLLWLGLVFITSANFASAAQTTISVASTVVIPVTSDGSSTVSLMVTNTGQNAALNVRALLNGPDYKLRCSSGSSLKDITQTTKDITQTTCPSIAVGHSCNLVFSSKVACLAEGNVLVTGDNISNRPTTAVAFSISGDLVFDLSNTLSSNLPQVIDTSNGIPEVQWGNIGVPVIGTSTTDGYTNTSFILNTPGIGANAAASCYNSQNGGFPTGTWYLPAICQFATSDVDLDCSNPFQTTISSLNQLGFITLNDIYWSSTTGFFGSPPVTYDFAWGVDFGGLGVSYLFRTQQGNVLCARAAQIP
jgi:hypothetical protein